MTDYTRAFVDGRGNSGCGAAACVLYLPGGRKIEKAVKLEPLSNNEAEYAAVRLAIKQARFLLVKNLIIHTDSQLVARQIEGKYKCKDPRMAHLRDRVWEEAKGFERIIIRWIPREQNKEADELCRKIDPTRRDIDIDDPRLTRSEENPFLRSR